MTTGSLHIVYFDQKVHSYAVVDSYGHNYKKVIVWSSPPQVLALLNAVRYEFNSKSEWANINI